MRPMMPSFVLVLLASLALAVVPACKGQDAPPAAAPDKAAVPAADPEPVAPESEVAPRSQAPKSDTLIVPGRSVGRISSATTRDDLVEIYTARSISDEPCYVGEGDEIPCSQVSIDGKTALRVHWSEAGKAESVEALSSHFQTAEGVAVGTSLAELVEKNGEPITFLGFDWDMGGAVMSLGDGRLARPGLGIVLGYDDGADERALAPLLGDMELRSDDPRVARVPIHVTDLRVPLRLDGP